MKLRRIFASAAVVAFGVAMAATITAAGAATPAQAGYDAVVCHTDTAYIYKYEDTSSTRLDALPRGAHFQVYHVDGGWDFGVRNYNSVSGNVLASQLCASGGLSATDTPLTPANATSAPSTAARADAANTPTLSSRDAVTPAQAVPGTYKCVTSPTLYLRNYPAGQAFNQLYQGQTFSVYEFRASGWARGYAFGHVNSDKSGYAAPYDNIWVETAYLGPC